MTPQRERLWTPDFTVLSIANLFSALIFYILMPTMASYAVTQYGVTTAEAGLAASAFLVGAVVGRPLAAFLMGGLSTRKVLLLGAIAYALTTACYLVPAAFTLVLVVRFANGACFGLVASALAGAVMSTVPMARRGEGSGWFGVGMSVSSGLGPFLGLLLYNIFGMTMVFVAVVISGLAVLVLVLIAAPHLSNVAPRVAGEARAPIVEPRALPIGAAVALSAVGFSVVLAFLNTATRGTNLMTAAAFYFPVYALMIMLSRPVAGRIQDLRGDDVVLVPAFAGAVVGLLLTALALIAGSAALLVIAAAFLGLGYGTLISAGQAFAVARVPRLQAGVAVASFFLVVDAGTGISPLVLGLLTPAFGFVGVYLAGALSALGGLILYVTYARRLPRYGLPAQPRPGNTDL